MDPPHNPTSNKVTPITMQAIVELNSDSMDYKTLVKNQVKTFIWSRAKFPDYEAAQGRRIKEWVRNRLGMEPQAFENQWIGRKGIRADINNALRHQRAYVLQQMKLEYFSESVMFFRNWFLGTATWVSLLADF